MSFEGEKLAAFEHKIIDLADQPNMQPDELKAYFDNNPEILRQGLNALCDALGDPTAAANLGFSQTAGVPETNVQDAIENVQAQVTAAIVGSIPSGSIDGDKLAQDVRNRLTNIETAATTEASTRASTDSSLQSQITAHNTRITAVETEKCAIYIGIYTGNGETSQFINLGFTPKAVIVFPQDALVSRSPYPKGAMALTGHKAYNSESDVLTISTNGFSAYQYSNSSGGSWLNLNGNTYFYMAFV